MLSELAALGLLSKHKLTLLCDSTYRTALSYRNAFFPCKMRQKTRLKGMARVAQLLQCIIAGDQ